MLQLLLLLLQALSSQTDYLTSQPLRMWSLHRGRFRCRRHPVCPASQHRPPLRLRPHNSPKKRNAKYPSHRNALNAPSSVWILRIRFARSAYRSSNGNILFETHKCLNFVVWISHCIRLTHCCSIRASFEFWTRFKSFIVLFYLPTIYDSWSAVNHLIESGP